MHRFAQVVVATEGEGEVADATAHMGTGQVLTNPSGGLNVVEGIGVMLLHAGGYGQYVGVENDVVGVEVELLGEQLVGTLAHLNLALVGVSLPLFIEGHHHYGSSVALDGACMVEEALFALL